VGLLIYLFYGQSDIIMLQYWLSAAESLSWCQKVPGRTTGESASLIHLMQWWLFCLEPLKWCK